MISNLSVQEFEDYRDADDAVYELNGKELLGERYEHFSFVFYQLNHDLILKYKLFKISCNCQIPYPSNF